MEIKFDKNQNKKYNNSKNYPSMEDVKNKSIDDAKMVCSTIGLEFNSIFKDQITNLQNDDDKEVFKE